MTIHNSLNYTLDDAVDLISAIKDIAEYHQQPIHKVIETLGHGLSDPGPGFKLIHRHASKVHELDTTITNKEFGNGLLGIAACYDESRDKFYDNGIWRKGDNGKEYRDSNNKWHKDDTNTKFEWQDFMLQLGQRSLNTFHELRLFDYLIKQSDLLELMETIRLDVPDKWLVQHQPTEGKTNTKAANAKESAVIKESEFEALKRDIDKHGQHEH